MAVTSDYYDTVLPIFSIDSDMLASRRERSGGSFASVDKKVPILTAWPSRHGRWVPCVSGVARPERMAVLPGAGVRLPRARLFPRPEHSRAKWTPVRVKTMRRNKDLEQIRHTWNRHLPFKILDLLVNFCLEQVRSRRTCSRTTSWS